MKHLKTFFGMLILFAAVSCNKAQQAGEGHVSFGVFNDDNVVDVTRSAVSSYTTLPQKGDFSIDIKDASSQTVWKGKVGDWDPAMPLLAGTILLPHGMVTLRKKVSISHISQVRHHLPLWEVRQKPYLFLSALEIR